MASRHTHAANRRHTADDANLRGIGIGASIIVLAIALSMGFSVVLVRTSADDTERATSNVRPSASPPVAGAIALQPAPADDIAAYRLEKQRQLNEYAWIDRDRGIVRIPIEEAMALLVRERSAERQQ